MPEVRLIDANALEQFYECGTDPNDPYADMTYIRSEHIENAPRIEAEPVQHGYWYIERKNAMSYGCTKCSNCHVAVASRGQAIAPNEYYCKNCGSKNSVNNEPLFGEQGGADNG